MPEMLMVRVLQSFPGLVDEDPYLVGLEPAMSPTCLRLMAPGRAPSCALNQSSMRSSTQPCSRQKMRFTWDEKVSAEIVVLERDPLGVEVQWRAARRYGKAVLSWVRVGVPWHRSPAHGHPVVEVNSTRDPSSASETVARYWKSV